MSTIAHGYNTIKLSDDTSLDLVICSEQTDEKNIRNTSWNDVYFNSNDEKIKIGSYDTTPNFVARNWIEYNDSCVIFLKQNICTSDVSVLKVFDIDTKKVLDLTDEEKTEFYYNQFPNSKIKSKKLVKKSR